MSNAENIVDIEKLQGLTEEQHNAILKSLDKRVGVLVGSAGTGKSYTTAKLLAAVQPHIDVVVCAPTGKAATRVNELLQANPLTQKIRCQTIHSALRPTKVEDDGKLKFSFKYCEHNQFEAGLFVIDESSMIDVNLMASLLVAIPVQAQVLFIGDPNQLPPVGVGKPFMDMIESGVIPVGRLKTVHRYSGRTGIVCNAIINNEKWEPSEKMDIDAECPENLRIIEAENDYKAMASAVAVVRKFKDEAEDPIRDIQVIVALNEKGGASRKTVNEKLRPVFNPGFSSEERISKGDKIILTSNAETDLVRNNDGAYETNGEVAFTCNGDMGVVVAIQDRDLIIKLWNPDRLIILSGADVFRAELAYGVTCHKFQGSGSPYVVVMTSTEHAFLSMVGSREWAYTALSRSSLKMVVCGKKSHLDKICKRQDIIKRRTLMKEELIYGTNAN